MNQPPKDGTREMELAADRIARQCFSQDSGYTGAYDLILSALTEARRAVIEECLLKVKTLEEMYKSPLLNHTLAQIRALAKEKP